LFKGIIKGTANIKELLFIVVIWPDFPLKRYVFPRFYLPNSLYFLFKFHLKIQF